MIHLREDIPGNTCPPFVVPMKRFTRRAGFWIVAFELAVLVGAGAEDTAEILDSADVAWLA